MHDARHTAATRLLEQGVDVRVVQKIFGRSSLAVTKR
ncbi:tyrosine-type recombinase/integrase [Kribbella qitaiheensis]